MPIWRENLLRELAPRTCLQNLRKKLARGTSCFRPTHLLVVWREGDGLRKAKQTHYVPALYVRFFLLQIHFVSLSNEVANRLALPSTLKICWACKAEKGQDDMNMCFTNTQGHWAGTLYADTPWESPPSYASIPHFHLKMLHADLLHIWNLGCGRDLAGSLISLLVRDSHLPGSNQNRRFLVATRLLQQFARRHGLNLSRKKLTQKSISMSRNRFPEYKGSGFDTYIVVKWLADFVQSPQCRGLDPQVRTVVWVANQVISIIYNAPSFMSAAEQHQIRTLGAIFIRTYLYLAHEAARSQIYLWRVRPKLHLLDHVLRCERLSGVNPKLYATWLDEDSLRRYMRINRLTHKRTSHVRVLQRWLLGLPGTWANLSKREQLIPSTAHLLQNRALWLGLLFGGTWPFKVPNHSQYGKGPF